MPLQEADPTSSFGGFGLKDGVVSSGAGIRDDLGTALDTFAKPIETRNYRITGAQATVSGDREWVVDPELGSCWDKTPQPASTSGVQFSTVRTFSSGCLLRRASDRSTQVVVISCEVCLGYPKLNEQQLPAQWFEYAVPFVAGLYFRRRFQLTLPQRHLTDSAMPLRGSRSSKLPQ